MNAFQTEQELLNKSNGVFHVTYGGISRNVIGIELLVKTLINYGVAKSKAEITAGYVATYGNDAFVGGTRNQFVEVKMVREGFVQNQEVQENKNNNGKFTRQIPTTPDWYWHWTGNLKDDVVAIQVHFHMKSNKCFVYAYEQLANPDSIWCEELGGVWLRMSVPERIIGE